MSYTLNKSAIFSAAKVGLVGTVGYRLFNADGSANGARVTAGIIEIIDRVYAAVVTCPDAFVGFIVWDTGDDPIERAIETINPQEAEFSDVKTSSRNATAPPSAAAIRAEIDANSTRLAAIYARTDVATSTRSSHTAAAVWAVGGRTLTGFGTLVADIVAAVWGAGARTLTAIADSAGVTTLLGRLTADRAALLDRLDVDPPDSPLIVIPAAPADLSLCRVYGYFEDLANVASTGITVSFRLSEKGPVKSERLITGRVIEAKITAGQLTDKNGNAWQDLQRNDNLTPAGSKYLVNCPELGLKNKEITLADELFDLASIVT